MCDFEWFARAFRWFRDSDPIWQKKTIKVKEVDATTQQKDSTGKTKRAGHETAEAFNPTWKYTPDKKQVILFSSFIQMVFHLPF